MKKGSSSKLWTRRGHRTWEMDNQSNDRVVKIWPSHAEFFKMRDMSQYPAVMWWPKFNDLEGAKKLIDAVMDEDLESLKAWQAGFPLHNMGIDGYVARLVKERKNGPRIETRILKTKPLARGFRLETETVTDRRTGLTKMRLVLRHGAKDCMVQRLATFAARKATSTTTNREGAVKHG